MERTGFGRGVEPGGRLRDNLQGPVAGVAFVGDLPQNELNKQVSRVQVNPGAAAGV